MVSSSNSRLENSGAAPLPPALLGGPGGQGPGGSGPGIGPGGQLLGPGSIPGPIPINSPGGGPILGHPPPAGLGMSPIGLSPGHPGHPGPWNPRMPSQLPPLMDREPMMM